MRHRRNSSARRRSRRRSSKRSSGWNTAATIPPASRRWRTAGSTAAAPRASCATSRPSSSEAPLSGAIGIGHTRWATHGKPNETNAHPHATDKLAVVHNGIIENFRELKTGLEAKGVRFETETDTEVVAQLVTYEMRQGRRPIEAVAVTLPRLRGAFALGFLFAGEEDLLIGARHGAPLAIGYGEGEMYLGSDALALAPFTDEVTYLDDGDWAILTPQGRRDPRRGGQPVAAAPPQDSRRLLHGRQGQPPPLHGEGDPRAAGGRRPHARPLRQFHRRTG